MDSFREYAIAPTNSIAGGSTVRDAQVPDGTELVLIERAIARIGSDTKHRPSPAEVATGVDEVLDRVDIAGCLELTRRSIEASVQLYFRQFFRPDWSYEEAPAGDEAVRCHQVWVNGGVRETEMMLLEPGLGLPPMIDLEIALALKHSCRRLWGESFGGVRIIFLGSPSQLVFLDARSGRFEELLEQESEYWNGYSEVLSGFERD